jgi:hypothetical protein
VRLLARDRRGEPVAPALHELDLDVLVGSDRESPWPAAQPNAGGTAVAAPDLNLLMVTTFGFVYQQTRDPGYLQWGDAVFREGIKRAWFGNTPTQADKQFNQQFRSAFRYFAYRQ